MIWMSKKKGKEQNYFTFETKYKIYFYIITSRRKKFISYYYKVLLNPLINIITIKN